MRVIGDVLAGIAAGAVTLLVALHVTAPESRVNAVAPAASVDERRPVGSLQTPSAGSSRRSERWSFSVPVIQMRGADADASTGEPSSFTALRNHLVDETGRAMHRRGVSVMDCLAGVELVGAQKIRFAAQIVSTPTEAIVGPWRFVEIVDGQVLPDAFPACAESALGTVGRITPEAGIQFPRYEGDIATVYRIEAP